MGNGNLSNCSRCGKLFINMKIDICPACIKEIDDEYRICAEYIKEHKLVNIYDLSEVTGVAVRQIVKFIKEGRISIADSPNLGYPCEACGTPINEGKLCKKCSERLKKDIKQVINKDVENNKDVEKHPKNTYYEIKNRF